MSITGAGQQVLRDRRNESTRRLAQALSAGFTRAGLDHLMTVVPLLDRLAQNI